MSWFPSETYSAQPIPLLDRISLTKLENWIIIYLMPRRNTLLITGEIYHIFNRSIGKIPILKDTRECNLFFESMKFYLQTKPPAKFPVYRKNRNSLPINLSDPLVTIINYCLMPNHFHITLRQEKEEGIRQFMHKVSNSFAHYFSIKHKRKGHLFEDKFKAVRVEDDDQLNHLSRYIHLNPVTSYLVKNPEDYPHSSYKVYIGEEKSDFINPSYILTNFSSMKSYKNFVMEQKNYQLSLGKIKHLLAE